jgi:hypothetical protein
MMPLPSLNLIERLALWILVRSRRTSLVMVKEHTNADIWWAVCPADPIAVSIAQEVQDLEPPSMMLERLFHAPAYGELE